MQLGLVGKIVPSTPANDKQKHVQGLSHESRQTILLVYTLAVGGTVGARGLAVDFEWSGGNTPYIFATTAEGSADRLIVIADTGSGSLSTTLATAPANEIFRGLEFTPYQVPEPSSVALIGLGAAALLFRRKVKS